MSGETPMRWQTVEEIVDEMRGSEPHVGVNVLDDNRLELYSVDKDLSTLPVTVRDPQMTSPGFEEVTT